MSLVARLINEKKIIICLGAGGVGKTTSATAIAVAAAKSGKRTALLSIDPAKRLAAALNIKLSFELTEVKLPGVLAGHLFATMIDQKTIFDDMVIKSTKDGKIRDKILNHSLYKAASNNFGGAVEYMALAKLQGILESKRFDLVVVDTPPDAHALDFLAKPNILSGFMDGKVMSWVIKPFHLAQKLGFSKLFAAGERLAGGLAEVAGIKALQTLAEFLVLMQETIGGFNKAGEALEKELALKTTAYCVVTTPRSSAVRSCKVIVEQLRKMGRQTDLLLVNRVIKPDIAESITHYKEGDTTLGEANACLRALRDTAVLNAGLIKDLQDSLTLLLGNQLPTQYVFDQTFDIHSSEGVMLLAQALAE